MANAYPTGFQGDQPEETAKDRGLFDCFDKKEGKEDVPMTEAEQKSSIMGKPHRPNSSSSEEEVEEDGVKIRRGKKEGLTDKIKEKLPGQIKEKLPGHKNEGAPHYEAAAPPHRGAPPHYETAAPPHSGIDGHGGGALGADEPHEKKGILEKIKEKLPGAQKDGDEAKKDHQSSLN